MMKKFGFYLLFVLSVIVPSQAQTHTILTTPIVQQPPVEEMQDTIPLLELSPSDLEKIPDVRTRLEQLNASFSAPLELTERLKELFGEEEFKLSEEALYWTTWRRDESTLIPSYMTFRDTVLVSRLFLPLLFKGERLPKDLTFYNPDTLKTHSAYDKLALPETLFVDLKRQEELDDFALSYVE